MAIKIDGMKKKVKTKDNNFADEKYTGSEPIWTRQLRIAPLRGLR